MATTIKLKNSVTTTAAPSSLVQGEVAANITDKKVWIGDASSSPVQILGAGAPVSGTTGTFTGNTTVAGTFAANGGTTLGDASGDALTINSSAVSIPNGLNFDSNTLVIDATNNRVGINTASPSAVLHVVGNESILDDGTNGRITLGASDASVNRISSTTTGFGAYRPIAYRATEHRFLSDGSTERMRITSAGNVGIGTSSPGEKLDVSGRIKFSAFSTDVNDYALYVVSGVGLTLASSSSGGSTAMAFRTGNAERMRLDSSGNLGLGVTPSVGNFVLLQTQRAAITGGANDRSEIAYNYYRTSGVDTYIGTDYASRYRQISGQHIWYYAPSGTAGTAATFTQAMTLDASGNLGVGTTSPTAKFHVSQTGTGTTGRFQSSASGSYINFVNASNSGVYIGSEGSAAYFETNGAERMRIDSSGNCLIGTTSADQGSNVGVKALPAGRLFLVSSASANTSDGFSMYSTGAAAYRFYVGYGGTINATSTTITGISDQRVKENIVDLDDGLNAVMALKPRKFDWKAGKGKDIKGDRGFIAQEFETVFPDMIEEWRDPAPEGEEPYKAVNANLIPVLVKAIQELKAEFDAYKATHP
jgi:hypothetical protein